MRFSDFNLFHRKAGRDRSGGVILMYHRVADLDSDPWSLSVTPACFEEHMRVLAKYGRLVQIRQMGKSPRRFFSNKMEIAVTFDDGYADNYVNAKPVLEKYGVPATFFIATGAIDSREEFWWDEIGRIILASKVLPEKFDFEIAGKRYRWRLDALKKETIPEEEAYAPVPANDSQLSRIRLFYVVWKILSRLPLEEKKEVLSKLAQWAGIPSGARPDHLAMTSEQLRSLARSRLFEMGAHTVHHPMLPQLSPQEQEEEIVRSRNFLEDMLDRRITSFAYPHGEYTEETLKILKRNKFKNACMVVPKRMAAATDPFLMPRFGVVNCGGEAFEYKIKSWIAS
jgi:peptidoglycan/xylan/chitin deacetylase (PgdA/CDA1 family)